MERAANDRDKGSCGVDVGEDNAGELDYEPSEPDYTSFHVDHERQNEVGEMQAEDGEINDLEEGEVKDGEEEEEEEERVVRTVRAPLLLPQLPGPMPPPILPLPPLPIQLPIVIPQMTASNTNSNSSRPEDHGVCKFFMRGHCTWGDTCKFVHVSPNKQNRPTSQWNKPPPIMPQQKQVDGLNHPPPIRPIVAAEVWHNSSQSPWRGPPLMPLPPTAALLPPLPSALLLHPPPPFPPPIISPAKQSDESAWERGLKQAREMMKIANEKKRQDAGFEEKRLVLPPSDNLRKTASLFEDSDGEFEVEQRQHAKRFQPSTDSEKRTRRYQSDSIFNSERRSRDRNNRSYLGHRQAPRRPEMQDAPHRRHSNTYERSQIWHRSRATDNRMERGDRRVRQDTVDRDERRWRQKRLPYDRPLPYEAATTTEYRDPWDRSRRNDKRKPARRRHSSSLSTYSSKSEKSERSRSRGTYSSSDGHCKRRKTERSKGELVGVRHTASLHRSPSPVTPPAYEGDVLVPMNVEIEPAAETRSPPKLPISTKPEEGYVSRTELGASPISGESETSEGGEKSDKECRREQLLKQLKSVEEAIAKKRSRPLTSPN